MGCLLLVVGLLLPRVAIVLVFLFTTWLETAFATLLWPVLGLIFAPYTTLAYTAAVVNTGGPITPAWLIVIVIAVILDLGSWGGSYRGRRRRVVVRE